jgi:hypothetical protein
LDELQALKDQAAIDRLVQTDYRFAGIKEDLNTHQITKDIARKRAKDLLESYSYYYMQMGALAESGVDYRSPEVTAFLLTDPVASRKLRPIFRDLVVFQSHQFWNQPNFTYKNPPGISETQLQNIVDLIHQKMAIYPKILKLSERGRPDPDDPTEIRLSKDPFVQRVFKEMSSGRINKIQAKNLLMTDLEWRTRLKEWNILGVVQLKTETGHSEGSALTLNDVEAELLARAHKH